MDSDKLDNLIQGFKTNPLEKESFSGLPEDEKHALLLSAELKSIPVQNPPRAVLRRKYAGYTQPAPAFSLSALFNLKFVGSLAAVVLMVSGAGLTYATWQSLPGQTLFSVKKSAEQFRVKFASNDIQKAYLQVQIAKKRVAEAEKLAASDNNTPELALAAVIEVAQATETASKKVKTLAPKDIQSSQNPLLSTLEDISKKEQDLVSGIGANDDTRDKQDVIALSLKNQTRVSEIKQAVETAAAEEAITSLSAGIGTVLVSGQISQIGKNTITIEKTQFITDDNTEIISQSGEKLSMNILKVDAKAAAAGKKINGKLFALKLTVFDAESDKNTSEDPKGQVKGEATNTEEPNSTTPETILKPILNDNAQDSGQASEPNPNSATGGYIFEDPSPKFVP